MYRLLYILTPTSELPALPPAVQTYRGVHVYTLTQFVITSLILAVTLTAGAPAFPVMIIALVPIRLHVMNRLFSRETLRFVDAWACREGTPEDDEDSRVETIEMETIRVPESMEEGC